MIIILLNNKNNCCKIPHLFNPNFAIEFVAVVLMLED